MNSAPTPSPQLEFEQERAAFEHQLPELKQTHGGQYVAVHRGMVVVAGSSEAEVTQRFFAKFGDTHVYIGYVGDQEPPTFQVSPITSAD